MQTGMVGLGESIVTGYMCKQFRHKCNEKGCYLGLLPSWDDIIERLPGAVRPTDIDGMVECSGHFLFIEEKTAGKSMEEGQRKALMRQSHQPNTTVVIIRPLIGAPSGMQALWFPNPAGFQDITRDEFLDWIRDWGTYARTNPPRTWFYESKETE